MCVCDYADSDDAGSGGGEKREREDLECLFIGWMDGWMDGWMEGVFDGTDRAGVFCGGKGKGKRKLEERREAGWKEKRGGGGGGGGFEFWWGLGGW